MRRRNLMTVLAGAAVYPLLAGAQKKAMPVIGFLASTSPEPLAHFVAAFRQGLSETGYVEGQNVALEYRWARITTTGCRNWPPSLSASRST